MATPPALSTLDVAAVLIVLAAALGWFNRRFLGLHPSIGMTLMGALASLLVVGADRLLPNQPVSGAVVTFLAGIDFRATLMDGMLSFLLFAGALHIDLAAMRRGRLAVLVLSTLGVLLSTALVAGGFVLIGRTLGLDVPLAWALVFGALISPTDPVAVMAIMKRAAVDPTLQATVAGESLFNDGVGVVVFAILLAAAASGAPLELGHAGIGFLHEAGGGVLLGLAGGWLAVRALAGIDDYQVEVLITLGLVMGGYAIAHPLGVSGPVAMAVAGLIVGNHGVARAMSETTRGRLLPFWELIDELLNAVLFMLIGLEAVAVPADARLIALGLAAIPLVLLARAASVALPLAALRPLLSLGRQAPVALIWGGLRGGISIALALGLPEGPARSALLAATYLVVLFAVIVQGGTIERALARR